LLQVSGKLTGHLNNPVLHGEKVIPLDDSHVKEPFWEQILEASKACR
jgi:hypothetical protein